MLDYQVPFLLVFVLLVPVLLHPLLQSLDLLLVAPYLLL